MNGLAPCWGFSLTRTFGVTRCFGTRLRFMRALEVEDRAGVGVDSDRD